MARNNDQISGAQLAAILSITMIGVGVLTLPRTLAEAVGPDALFVVLLGTLLVFIIGLLMTGVVRKFPKKTLMAFSGDLVGKPLGMAVAVLFLLYFVIFAAFEVRMFGEIAKTYLLLNTPIEILMVTFLLSTAYLVRSGIEPIARMSQILFPVVLGTAVLVMVPVLPELDFTHFLPVLKTPILKIVQALPLMIFSYFGIELTLILSGFVIDERNIGKNVIFAVTLTGAIYLLTVTVTIARFGLVETTHILWPTLELFKTVDLPGAFIENIHIYAITIWVFSVLMTLAGVYFGASLTLSQLFKSKEQNYFVLPLAPLIYYIALMPDNLIQTTESMDVFSNYFGSFILAGVPVTFLVISIFKKQKGGKKRA